jgi:predicted RNase H-like HicB family nuclease
MPGVMAYGSTKDEAISMTEILALRALANRLEHGESIPLNELFAETIAQFTPK